MKTIHLLSLILAGLLNTTWVNAEALKKLSLDTGTSGLSVQADTRTKVEGKASLKVKTSWPTTISLGDVSGLDVQGATLVLRAKAKSELEGEAHLEMWIQVAGRTFFSKGLNSTVTGKEDWKTIQTPFVLDKGQKPEKVSLTLVVNGKGSVWVDDVVLAKE